MYMLTNTLYAWEKKVFFFICFSMLRRILYILLNAVTADVVSRRSDPSWDTSRCDTVLGPPSPHHPA